MKEQQNLPKEKDRDLAAAKLSFEYIIKKAINRQIQKGIIKFFNFTKINLDLFILYVYLKKA